MVHRSAVDSWFYLVVIATAAIVLAAAYPAIRAGDPVVLLIVAITAAAAIGLPLWLLFSTNYTVTSDLLIVRSGPFIWRIPRSQIRAIQPSRSLLSSPALSLNRLEVRYGDEKSILVSPADKDAFIESLGFDV